LKRQTGSVDRSLEARAAGANQRSRGRPISAKIQVYSKNSNADRRRGDRRFRSGS
jgi:hypothetical protein